MHFLFSHILIKFSKFFVVGGLSFFLDFGSTWFSKEKMKLNKYVSNTIGFFCGTSFNFFLNRLWSFESHEENVAGQFLYFLLWALCALGINNLLIYFFSDKLKQNFYVSKIGAVILVMPMNFLVNHFVIYRR